MQIEKTLERAGGARLRLAALYIFGGAVLATASVFMGAVLLAALQYFIAASAVMLLGVIVILAVALQFWQTASEKRLHMLIRRIKEARKAQSQAEAESLENQRILATMSHEIRTPLNGVIGMLNLLLESNLSPEQRNYAETSHASGRTLLSIIDEILDTAKGKATEATAPRQTAIRPLVESVTELLAARAHAKQIEISSHVSDQVPEKVAVSDTHLRQILFNLAGNAVKFTQQGGVAIDIGCDDAGGLHIAVADTGIGMTQDEVQVIFNDYSQANATTAHKFGGTGLGLGIARRIALQLGGMVDVTSTPGSGTTFSVTLPGVVGRADALMSDRSLTGLTFHLALRKGLAADHLAQSLVQLGAGVTRLETPAALRSVLRSDTAPAAVIADTSHADVLRHWAKSYGRFPDLNKQVWSWLIPEERRKFPDLLTAPFAGYLLKPARKRTLARQLGGAPTEQIAVAAKELRAIARKAQGQRKLRLLVADDNPVNLLLTRTMLEKAGHRVTTVTDGHAVLAEQAKGKLYDVLLLDIEMPGLDGYETVRRLRAVERDTPHAKPLTVIALTAHMRQQDLDLCLELGMNDYLIKPFDHHDLHEIIAKNLKRSRAA